MGKEPIGVESSMGDSNDTVAVHCVISAAPRRRGLNGGGPVTRSEDPAATSAFKAKMETEEAKTIYRQRSQSSRTPGSKSDVDSGNFDAGDKRRRRWKLLGLALVTTSSAGSAYDASSIPQQLLLLKQTQMNSLEPLQAENRQGEALYRVRIVDTRTYPRLYADEQHWARTRPNVL
jgi:hypothetical protein